MKRMIVLVVSILFAGSTGAVGPKGGNTRIDDQRFETPWVTGPQQVQTNSSKGLEGLLTKNRGDKDRPVPKTKMKRQRNADNALLGSSSDYIKVRLNRGDKDRPIPRVKNRYRTSRSMEVENK